MRRESRITNDDAHASAYDVISTFVARSVSIALYARARDRLNRRESFLIRAPITRWHAHIFGD